MNRRSLLTLAVSGPLLQSARSRGRAVRTTSAVAFDGFAVFDPRSVATRVEELFPGKSTAFLATWRTRQFEYTWLRTLIGSYTDFARVTEDALVYTAKTLNLELPEPHRQALMRCFSELHAWPDAAAALGTLHNSGIRLVLLSNLTLAMLNTAASNSGLQSLFEPHLSTDGVRAYKPDPRAYSMAVDALKLRRNEIVFAAFAGWDAAGAKAFGFTTFWVNRMNSPVEELGSRPDGIGTNLNDLVRFVLRGSHAGHQAGTRPTR
jgi:2-haloacid dehalogenase